LSTTTSTTTILTTKLTSTTITTTTTSTTKGTTSAATSTTKPAETTTSTTTPEIPAPTKPFNLGCKVPDHNGPLGEGWEANRMYRESINQKRRTNPEITDGELDPEEFGIWTDFAICLKNVLHLIEGQAYFKETGPKVNGFNLDTNTVPIFDDGTENGAKIENNDILAGAKIGASRYASEHAKGLYNMVQNSTESNRFFHGAGTRYNEEADGSNSIVVECRKYLPEHVRNDPNLDPMTIQVIFLLLS